MTWRARWAEATRLDRAITLSTLLIVALGVFSRPMWRNTRSRLKVTLLHRAQATTDPWGSAWQTPDATRVHSPGPNRVYEQGSGDDLLVLPEAAVEPYLYGLAPWALILFGLSLGVTYRLARGEERTGLADEAGRAVFTAIPLGAYALALTVALSVDRGAHPPVIDRLALDTISPVPTPILLAATAYACSVMFVLAVRMSQPQLQVPRDYTYYVGYDAPTGTQP